MNNSSINSTINSTTVGELADATSLRVYENSKQGRQFQNNVNNEKL